MKQKVMWECSDCGHKERKWVGCCNRCGAWNSFMEQIVQEVTAAKMHNAKPLAFHEVKEADYTRELSHMPELDRLLGGGMVKGSVILLGGAPGIGKSTLLLQLGSQCSKQGKVLYVCAEESESQTMIRAKRIGITPKELFLFHSHSLPDIHHQIEELSPKVMIIDSLQLLHHPEITSSPGSLVQVREAAHLLTQIAKERGITLFLVSHVTKTGEIAGPKVVEHIVDVVLEFEGDKEHGFRMLRSIKNRFGPTNEMALFDMQEKGLVEVENPSSFFLAERAATSAGCAAVATQVSGRSFLLEVQALVTPTYFPSPMRKAAGIDSNRLALLLAVLEKKVGYSLHSCDVFVSLTGGIKVTEPAIDLGIILAIASSFLSKTLDPQTVILGEVGLAGEVRSIPCMESRIKEAMQMGFTKVICPKRSLSSIKHLQKEIRLQGVSWVNEAIDAACLS